MKLEEFQKDHWDRLYNDGQKFNERKIDCAYLARRMIAFGMVGGGSLAFFLVNALGQRYNISLAGKGFVIGGVASITGFFYSRYKYNQCIDNYIAEMRKVARLRHSHYFEQLTDKKPFEKW